MGLALKLEAANLAADALAESVLLGDGGHAIIIEFVPALLQGRLDEGKVVT